MVQTFLSDSSGNGPQSKMDPVDDSPLPEKSAALSVLPVPESRSWQRGNLSRNGADRGRLRLTVACRARSGRQGEPAISDRTSRYAGV